LLWSFVYLVVRNLFALVWLLARPRRSNESEILVLRQELAVLRRRPARPVLTRADRALLASLSRALPRAAWSGFPVKPETLLRWHRQLVARRWTYAHKKPGRPPLEPSLRTLILRLADENPQWGYRRIVGELTGVGIAVSATSVRKVLLEAGVAPATERGRSSWRAFVRTQAASTLACDLLTVETAFLQRIYVLFFISLARRRIEYIACTPNPDGRWGGPAGSQPHHATGRAATVSVSRPRPRLEVQSRLRRRLPFQGDEGDPDACPGAERECSCPALGTHGSR
jgi:putative transposase